MIKRSETYQLICDVCEKETEVATMENHVENGWKWHRYIQMPGYSYSVMVCTDECRVRWESIYKERLMVRYERENDLLQNFGSEILTTTSRYGQYQL